MFRGVSLGLTLLDLLHPAGGVALFGEDEISPGLSLAKILANDLGQSDHPAVLLGGAVGVEVDGLAVGEAHTEAFFDEHVAFFLFGEGGFSPTSFLGRNVASHQGGLVVDELAGFGEVDRSSRLPCSLVVGCEFGTIQREESTSPILKLVSYIISFDIRHTGLTGQSPPCWLK